MNTAFVAIKLTVYGPVFLKERSTRVCHYKVLKFYCILLSAYIAQDQGVTKSCRLSWLTNSALVNEP